MPVGKLSILALLVLVPSVCALNASENVSLNETVNDTIITIPSIIITEIHFNPDGEDSGHEFIEIWSDSIFNYSELVVGDHYANDSLSLLHEADSRFILIVDEYANISVNCTVLSADGLIGNGLGNGGDGVFVWYLDSLLDSKDYSGPGGQGHSIQLIDGSWSSATPTPCAAPLEPMVYNKSADNISDEPIPETCPSGLAIELSRFVYESGETIRFIPHFAEGSASIRYWVEDYYGSILKQPVTSSKITERRYTPSVDETKLMRIVAESVVPDDCKTERTERYAAVVGEQTEIESTLSIDTEYDADELCEEPVIQLSLEASRGNTQKRVVELKATQDGRRISDTLKLTLETKGSSVNVKIPLYLDRLDCEGDRVTVKAAGLGFEETEELDFERKEPAPEPEQIECPQVHNPSQIERAYTLAKKFRGEPIILRVRIGGKAESGVVYAIPSDAMDVSAIAVPGETAELSVTPIRADESYIFLYISGNSSDVSTLTLSLEEDKTIEIIEEPAISAPVQEISSNISLLSITGSVVREEYIYTSPSSLASKYAPYVLLTLLGGASAIWFLRR